MSLDYKTAIYNQVWALLEANSAFSTAVKAGCRIKADDPSFARQLSARAAADFPQAKLELKDAKEGPPPQTFGMNSASFTPAQFDAPVPVTQQLLLTITYDALKQSANTPVEAAVRAALYGSAPKLGLSYVTGFTITEQRALTKDAEAAGTSRRIVRLTIIVSMRLMLSQLTP